MPDIARLVDLVAERTQARRINLIAFSCGGPPLAQALVELRNRYPTEDHAALQRRYRIANAIFVAADIDLQTFANARIWGQCRRLRGARKCMCRRTTGRSRLPAYSRDLHVWGAELTRDDLESLASNERLVGVDVTGVNGAHELGRIRGHGYWIANQWVASDVLLSMVYPFDPTWRGLVHPSGRGLWTFPEDYPQRVGSAVYEIAPELRREGE